MKYLKFISYFFFFLLLMIPVRAFWRNYFLIDEGVSEAIFDLLKVPDLARVWFNLFAMYRSFNQLVVQLYWLFNYMGLFFID